MLESCQQIDLFACRLQHRQSLRLSLVAGTCLALEQDRCLAITALSVRGCRRTQEVSSPTSLPTLIPSSQESS